jgi:perosamine synthetase
MNDSPPSLPFLPFALPEIGDEEIAEVVDTLKSGWVTTGPKARRFEQDFAAFLGDATLEAISVNSATAGLHLALEAVGVGPGDEVVTTTHTFTATAEVVRYLGADVVLVDIDPATMNIDPRLVEAAITPRTKAIVPVHLYGAVCDMPALRAIAQRHELAIVEDCAEALGSTLGGRHAGMFGDVGTFSFFGNKTITTGEGGMVITNDDALAERLRLVKGQGQSATRRYWHVELGFNYRMTNICAAIGLAQMERLEAILARKHAIAELYREKLANLPITLQQKADDVVSSDWLFSLLVPQDADREDVMRSMGTQGVETRPVFSCAHLMPMYQKGETFPVSEGLSKRGISLPSYPGMSDSDVDRVVEALRMALAEGRMKGAR